MKQMHWFVGYEVLLPNGEILFTGGEFSEVETREEAVQIVLDKQGQFGTVKIKEVEHLDNPYKKAKRS